MKRYKFEITVTEGSSEMWDEMNDQPEYAADYLQDVLGDCLYPLFYDGFTLKFIETLEPNGQLSFKF